MCNLNSSGASITFEYLTLSIISSSSLALCINSSAAGFHLDLCHFTCVLGYNPCLYVHLTDVSIYSLWLLCPPFCFGHTEIQGRHLNMELEHTKTYLATHPQDRRPTFFSPVTQFSYGSHPSTCHCCATSTACYTHARCRFILPFWAESRLSD